MWSGIWSMTTAWYDFWIWIWSTRHCGLGQEKACWKTQLVLFDWSNSAGAIDVKMDGLLLRKNHLLRCWSWLSRQDWIWALTLSLLPKLPPRKLELWFVLRSWFLLRLLCISINLPYTHVWNSVVTSGLVLRLVTWNC